MQGQKFGRYEIQWELGRGGMATVYQGYDPMMKREVAIKALPRALAADPEFRDRFQREAQVIAALEHPYIVPVYDYGEENQQAYIVMRLMTGGALTRRIKRGALNIVQAAAILERMAEALEAAHAIGIIHRDIKPDNIMYDKESNSYLGDFGIVRILTGSGAITSGTIAGTPGYMSPEQVHADEAVDARADVYGLGVVLFEMLTGQTPYQAPEATRLMMKHVLEPVPDILALRADLPEELQPVIFKALAKSPDDRYQTPLELADAVARVGRQLLSRRARRRLTADDLEELYDRLSDIDQPSDEWEDWEDWEE